MNDLKIYFFKDNESNEPNSNRFLVNQCIANLSMANNEAVHRFMECVHNLKPLIMTDIYPTPEPTSTTPRWWPTLPGDDSEWPTLPEPDDEGEWTTPSEPDYDE